MVVAIVIQQKIKLVMMLPVDEKMSLSLICWEIA